MIYYLIYYNQTDTVIATLRKWKKIDGGKL